MSDLPPLIQKVGMNTTDYKTGVIEINRSIRVIESGFRASAAALGDWSKSSSGLESRMKALSSLIDLQNRKVEAIRGEYERVRKEKGENSRAAQELQIKLNKETESLGKLQNELNHTENSLKGMKNESGKVKGAVKDMGAQFDKLKQQVPALGTAFSLLTNPITLAIATIGAFVAISKKATSETVAYNKQVRETMQLTGLSAEETSRLIQVADDWGIDIGVATSSMEMMNKKGITPSIDNLAKIADEYMNAADKTAFMEIATKKYGKSFSNLVPILAKGGDVLRDHAAAINDNMIATDESIAAAREWEVAMDNLDDTATGLKYTLGNKLLPTIIDVTEGLNNLISANIESADAADLLRNAHKAGLITDKQLAIALRDIRTGAKSASDVIEQYADELKILDVDVQQAIKSASGYSLHLRGVKKSTEEVAETTEDAKEALAKFSYEEESAKIAADKLSWAYDDMNLAINGRLGPEMEDFTSDQADLEQQMKDVQAEIDKAIKDGYNPMGEKVLDLKGKYDDLKGQYDDNATAHDEATKRIMFDILEQRAAIGGLSQDELKVLDDIRIAWGLTDQTTLDYMNRSDQAMNWLRDHPGDVSGAEKIINGQETAWSLAKKEALLAHDAVAAYHDELNKVDGKTVTTEIIQNITTHHQGEPYIGGQHGLHMIAPSGFPNDSLPVMVSSGEEVIVIPPEKRFGNSLATIQQLIIQVVRGLNSQNGLATSGGGMVYGRQLQPAASPIQIILQGVPDQEIKMRRLARYVADEFERRRS